MKKPWIAAILNLLFFGAGYIYNGKRVWLGVAMIVSWILIRIGEISIYLTDLVFHKWLILFIGIVVMQLSLTVDAYREAKSINSAL
jgi:hypothetical protein